MSGSSRYARETVAQVLTAVDIADYIGQAVELKPAGAGRMKGLCPFHQEKTPSFHVSRDRQMYHCFGCGKGGDLISFLCEHEGLSFVEALRKLADRAGIRLPVMSGGDARREMLRTRLQELNRFAARYFEDQLKSGADGGTGEAYLNGRALKVETQRRFHLGYVGAAWDGLLEAAKKAGYKNDELAASGLFRQGQRGNWFDLFRNRLMFPIRDVSGNVVAFGGRALDDSPAKYINSPETPVYKKSRVFFGLDQARDAIRRESFAILVEGYFDALRCFDAGIENVVAPCGTALTPEQARLLHRYCTRAVIVFDGDAAGVSAALKATSVLMGAGIAVSALCLPDNQDPDDFIRAQGAEAFRDAIGRAPDFLSFYVGMNRERTASIEGRTELAHEMFPILRDVDDELRRDEYLKRLAKELGLNEWACRNEFQKALRGAARHPRPEPRGTADDSGRPEKLARDDCGFVAALLHDGRLRERAREALEARLEPSNAMHEVLRAIFDSRTPHDLNSAAFDSPAAQRLLSAAVNSDPPGAEAAQEIVEKQIARFEREALTTRARMIQRQLLEAEHGKDNEAVMRLLTEKVQVERRLREVGAA